MIDQSQKPQFFNGGSRFVQILNIIWWVQGQMTLKQSVWGQLPEGERDRLHLYRSHPSIHLASKYYQKSKNFNTYWIGGKLIQTNISHFCQTISTNKNFNTSDWGEGNNLDKYQSLLLDDLYQQLIKKSILDVFLGTGEVVGPAKIYKIYEGKLQK